MKGITSRKRIVEFKIDNAWNEYKAEKGEAFWNCLSKLEYFNIANAFFWASKKGVNYSEAKLEELAKITTENAIMKDFIEEHKSLYNDWKEKYGL